MHLHEPFMKARHAGMLRATHHLAAQARRPAPPGPPSRIRLPPGQPPPERP